MTSAPLALIRAEHRLRRVDEAKVATLMASIAEVGLLNPVTVYRRPVIRDGQAAEGYGVLAGAHRLEACKRLGIDPVPVTVLDLDEPRRIIAECDENLCAPTLTPAERAVFTAERKKAYQALHPETKHEETLHRGPGRKLCDPETRAPRFTADTAAKTGRSERAVQLDAQRGEAVAPEALALVRGTALDTGAFLDRLRAAPATKQADMAREALAAPKPRRAPAPTQDDDAFERQVAALVQTWNRAAPEVRDAFLTRIGAVRRAPRPE